MHALRITPRDFKHFSKNHQFHCFTRKRIQRTLAVTFQKGFHFTPGDSALQKKND